MDKPDYEQAFADGLADALDLQFNEWFEQLAGEPGRVRVTGWETWQAALVRRGVHPAAIALSRLAFNDWLETARAGDWLLRDAWFAAAKWHLERQHQ
jgi:hypothetical protein